MACVPKQTLAGALLLAAAFSAPPASSSEDTRQRVEMPAPAQQLLRQDMVDHLVVLNQLFGHLAAGEYAQAAELAETRLGRSAMGKHRGSGVAPGRFMPNEMHQLGMSMHDAASEFAANAANKDPAAAFAALQRLTGYCVACHASYRIR